MLAAIVSSVTVRKVCQKAYDDLDVRGFDNAFQTSKVFRFSLAQHVHSEYPRRPPDIKVAAICFALQPALLQSPRRIQRAPNTLCIELPNRTCGHIAAASQVEVVH